MAIDAYSPCPGGTGKKIKFCCNDLLGELQKIDRMLEGKQFLACLNHVESLLKKNPDRACLLATKSLLLGLTEQPEAAQQAIRDFFEKHPENPIALADAASLAVEHADGRTAMRLLQRALAASGEGVEMRVYAAMGDVAEALAVEGEVMAALPLLHAQIQLQPNDPHPKELAIEIQQSRVPVLLKDQRWMPDAPDNAPWKPRYDDAVDVVKRLQWSVCEERLTKLAAEMPGEPIVWRGLATVRGWLADNEGAVEALQRYASLDVPLDDAVEAEALSRMLMEDPLGDREDIFALTFSVNDVEQLQTALALSRKIEMVQIDPASLSESDEPPPRAIYQVRDQAAPEISGEFRLEDLPRDLGIAMLFGRQTDREARLEISEVFADDLARVQSVLAEAAGKYLGDELDRRQVAQVSRTRALGSPRRRLPENADAAVAREAIRKYLDSALLEQWPRLPLGCLGGKTPEEAARLDEYRIKVHAAVMVVESWFESFDVNRLREHLGLPAPEAIDLGQNEPETIPIGRWHRLMVEKLADDQLLKLFRVASVYNAVRAIEHLGNAIIERPSLQGNPEKLRAYSVLALAGGATDRGLEYIDRGRKEAEAMGQSSAPWDLQELQFRFARMEGEETSRLLTHLESQHGREPGVREALLQFLIQIGAVGPDGQLRTRPQEGAAAEGAPAAREVEPEPGKLWTPESQRPAGEKAKIWMPGMD